jgi:8-oxo-(d)GTP phosphatase
MPSNKPESKLIKAAGAVAWRPGPDGEPEILLVHRKKYDDWSLPKGKMEPGEPLPVTAVREVLEEGGSWLSLGRRLVSVRYNVGGRPKRVHYWAARVTGIDELAVPNSEVDQVEWLPVARAIDRVSYARDHGVLHDFAARPAGTVPLILLRHAKAQAKSDWKGDDADRPLDDAGAHAAKALAELLACFAPRARVISSPAVRCTETVRPYALRFCGEAASEESLYIRDSAATDPAYLRSLIAGLVAAGEPTVLCAHRENLPAIQEAALAVLAPVPGTSEPADGAFDLAKEWDDTLPTAGFWVLNVAPVPPDSPGSPASDASASAAGSAARDASASATGSAARDASASATGSAADPAEPQPGQAAEPESGQAAGEPAASGTDGTHGTLGTHGAPRRPRWLRGRFWPGLTGRRVGPGGPGSPGLEADPNAAPQAPWPAPVGVLVSADRYDLSET